MKTRWKKTANSRIEMPDYCERSIFEALVNALIHRDYLILGSEVHIDIYDDRLTITSPGGMADGTRIQERDISDISSTRRNPVLADIFGRLGYMERQGSGFKKITESYRAAHNYRDELEPKFYSDASSFQVTLYNLNYGTAVNATKAAIEDENVAIAPVHLAIEIAIDKLNASQATIAKAKAVFANMGVDGIFGRSDIAAITNDSVTAAGNLITKLKNADLIEPVSGFGKGKYTLDLLCTFIVSREIQNDECAILFLNIKKDSVKSILPSTPSFAFAMPIKYNFDVFSNYFLMWC